MHSAQTESHIRTQDAQLRERPPLRQQSSSTSPRPGRSGERPTSQLFLSPEVRDLLQQGTEVVGLEVDDVDEEGEHRADDEGEGDDGARSDMSPMSGYPGIQPAFQVEHPYENGQDSATIDSARTLYAEDFDYVVEHGRHYCGDYFLPVDQTEQTRQFVIDQVYKKLFDLELTTVPLENPRYILDIGTGVGEWAVDMADKYPGCEVFGTDIAPIQPTEVPFNIEFHIENAEDEWIRPADTVDLVHLRNMEGAFSDWPFVYAQAFACIRPGGWIEIIDWEDFFADKNFMSLFPEDWAVHVLVRGILEAAEIAGKPRGAHHLDKNLLIDAGFVDIHETAYDMGIGPRENSRYGLEWLFTIVTGIEATCLRLLTKHLGWDVDEVRQLCDKVARETRMVADDPTRAEPFVVKLRVIVGRKPFVAGQWTAKTLNENGEIGEYPSGDESTIGTRTIRSEDTI